MNWPIVSKHYQTVTWKNGMMLWLGHPKCSSINGAKKYKNLFVFFKKIYTKNTCHNASKNISKSITSVWQTCKHNHLYDMAREESCARKWESTILKSSVSKSNFLTQTDVTRRHEVLGTNKTLDFEFLRSLPRSK